MGVSMNLPLFLDAILTVAVVTLIGFLVSVAIQLQKTLASADRLLKNIDDKVEPISSNLISSLERVNGDLGRIDDVVKTIQEMSERVQNTMEVVREVITSPLVKVASFSAGTREAIKKFISRD